VTVTAGDCYRPRSSRRVSITEGFRTAVVVMGAMYQCASVTALLWEVEPSPRE
jgi:hypothetical protein